MKYVAILLVLALLASLVGIGYLYMTAHVTVEAAGVIAVEASTQPVLFKELQSQIENGRLIGMLCINFDDSRYRKLSNEILSLCHPDMFVEDVVLPSPPQPDAVSASQRSAPEKFRNSTEAVAVDAINRELDRLGVTADRLTSEERLKIITALESNGIFLLKGAVKDVAAGLCCSQASVYRYLSQVKNDNT